VSTVSVDVLASPGAEGLSVAVAPRARRTCASFDMSVLRSTG
jgi:hypothetical protein